MKIVYYFLLVLLMVFSQAVPQEASASEKGKTTDIKKAARDAQIEMAMNAAPASVSMDATIMVFGPDGTLVEAKKGTNGFTCIPDIGGQEQPDPFCGNAPAMQWVNDLVKGSERPSNTEPGVAYMMQGGWHWEKDGKIIMDKNETGAMRVKEPPHWMVFWPFGSKDSMLPVVPGKFGAYIMWDGTPYAHLMIYQDPRGMK